MRGLALLALVGCAGADLPPAYLSQSATQLDADLVQVNVTMTGPRDDAGLTRFAECVAARYALRNDAGFARLVRINFSQASGISGADAVYTISAALPPGVTKIDAEVTVQTCAELGIPTL